MIINDLDDYYIVFDTKNRNTELDTLTNNQSVISQKQNIVIADLHAKVGKDKMSFPTSSIFNITLKLFL